MYFILFIVLSFIFLGGAYSLYKLAYNIFTNIKKYSELQRYASQASQLSAGFFSACVAWFNQEFNPGGYCYESLARSVREGYYPCCDVSISPWGIQVDFRMPEPINYDYDKYCRWWERPDSCALLFRDIHPLSEASKQVLNDKRFLGDFFERLRKQAKLPLAHYHTKALSRTCVRYYDYTELHRRINEEIANMN